MICGGLFELNEQIAKDFSHPTGQAIMAKPSQARPGLPIALVLHSAAGQVLVLSKYGKALVWRSWQLAQARATKQT